MVSSLPIGVRAYKEMTEGLSDHRGPRTERVLVDASIEFDHQSYGQSRANLTQAVP